MPSPPHRVNFTVLTRISGKLERCPHRLVSLLTHAAYRRAAHPNKTASIQTKEKQTLKILNNRDFLLLFKKLQIISFINYLIKF
jgi:hypothetical protein